MNDLIKSEIVRASERKGLRMRGLLHVENNRITVAVSSASTCGGLVECVCMCVCMCLGDGNVECHSFFLPKNTPTYTPTYTPLPSGNLLLSTSNQSQ